MTDAEREAFLRGYAYGAEAMILAHDPLLEALAVAAAVERAHVGDRLADWHDECVEATMAKVRALRGEQGERDALHLYAIEVA
jgi:hypothetical protein